MTRSGIERKPPKNPVPPEVYAAVMARENGVCPRCKRSEPLQLHHRKKRSQGGRHSLENCVGLCLWCHDEVENNPAQAKADGWWL